MWHPIGTENYDVGLELAVIVDGRVQWSLEPCRRVVGGWVRYDNHEAVPLRPTHWRPSSISVPFGTDWQRPAASGKRRAEPDA